LEDFIFKEKKYKDFKIHLELLHDEFEDVKEKIPKHLTSLYEPHIKQTLDVINPGCYILTWSSLNIGIKEYNCQAIYSNKTF
jgi:dynein heavy chain, axonemal